VVHRPAAVDFTKLMVIGVWNGASTSNGPKVVIEAVEERAKSVLVTYKIAGKPTFDPSNPHEITLGTAVHTYPFRIVSVKRSSKRVYFKEVD
jgi:hypothetical protein